MPIKIVEKFISLSELKELAKERFGDMVKAVVDIEKGTAAFGGELHADEEALLLDAGSKQTDLWGINIYVDQPKDAWVEFDSMINLRPSQNNIARSVEDVRVQKKISGIIDSLIK